MYHISVEKKFKASHHIKGLEERHGHLFTVRITAKKKQLDRFCIAIDFKVLRSHLDEIITKLDNGDLNRFIEPPSCENIAK
ncbi:MAG TPA: 6-carboxytetrahydropterin synthase QueD, partial [bacterium (Candidatus Stahlbacteria)]|nr:6-carboxytetrahydropterin synthase QueD [Candidatus Stahlbacteria bacterium]